jgi:hypothetical protein
MQHALQADGRGCLRGQRSGRRRRTTCAWPRLRKSTVRRRGPTRPPLLALMKAMRGVSATPGPTNGLAPTRYSAGILRQPGEGGKAAAVIGEALVNQGMPLW